MDSDKLLKLNIGASFIIKLFSIFLGFSIVPISLDLLGPDKYGIWIAISSIIIWINFFDLGLGNGLQIKLSESIAKNDTIKAKRYITNAYFAMFALAFVLFIVYLMFFNLIDWSYLLNYNKSTNNKVVLLIRITILSFLFQFVIQIIKQIFFSFRYPALAKLADPLSMLITFVLLIVFRNEVRGSLLYIGLLFVLSPIFVYLFMNLIFFYRNKIYIPRIKHIDISTMRSLLLLGSKFFIIQLCVLVLFQSSTILISHFYGSEEVTRFSIAYKLFSGMYMIFNLIVTPVMPFFTHAWAKKDINWIRTKTKQLLLIWTIIFFGGLLVLLLSQKIYSFWIGNEVLIPWSYSVALFIYFAILTFGGIFTTFINGIGVLKVQLYSNLFSIVIFAGLIYYFNIYTTRYLALGVLLPIILSNFFHPIIAPIQYYLVIKNKAKGIWLR